MRRFARLLYRSNGCLAESAGDFCGLSPHLLIVRHGKAETHGLSVIVVGILSYDDYPDLVKGGAIHRSAPMSLLSTHFMRVLCSTQQDSSLQRDLLRYRSEGLNASSTKPDQRLLRFLNVPSIERTKAMLHTADLKTRCCGGKTFWLAHSSCRNCCSLVQ